MLRFLTRLYPDSQLKSGWSEPLRVGGHAPFSPAIVSLLEVGNAKYIMWVNTSLTKEIRIKNMPVSSRTVFRINKKLKKETLQSEYKLTEGDILILQYQ